ncbi:DsbA family protein [Leptolyngbya ohadii]|uniref:DsbA family protein n=1 Tax=Leptolyngbya ohadii TaxID=1962290 RepID=UPI000B5A1164|nr:DsbA family protein [Leptolyngbya ohadii]
MSVLTAPVSQRDHIQGSEAAIVTLVEYGDYQCPHCAEVHKIIGAIQQQLGNSLRFVFRHFPQSELHPDSLHAAEAAEAAGSQGKFWEMHDRLFAAQNALDDGSLVEYAVDLNLEINQFLSEMAGDVHLPRITQDQESGTASGVCSTPALFLNGSRYCGSTNHNRLFEAIDRLITPA